MTCPRCGGHRNRGEVETVARAVSGFLYFDQVAAIEATLEVVDAADLCPACLTHAMAAAV